MADGAHSIEVQTKDTYERWSDSASYDVTVDTTGPVITLNEYQKLLLPKGAVFEQFERGAAAADANLDSTAVDYAVGNLDSNNDGAVYNVVYSAVDELDNVGTATLEVYIVDLTKLNLAVLKNPASEVIEGGQDLTFTMSGLDSELLDQISCSWTAAPQNTGLGVLGFADQVTAAGENLVASVSYDNPSDPQSAVMDLTMISTVTKNDASTADYESAKTFSLYPDSTSILGNPGFEEWSGDFTPFNREGISYPDYLSPYNPDTGVQNVDAYVNWGFSYLVYWETYGEMSIRPSDGGYFTGQKRHFGFGNPIITNTGYDGLQAAGEVVSTLAKGPYPRTGNYCAVVGDLDRYDRKEDIEDFRGFIFDEVDLIPGMTYELSVWVYSEANLPPSEDPNNYRDCIWMGVFDNNNIETEVHLGTPAQQLAFSGWQQISVTFAATQKVTRIGVEFSWSNQGSSGGHLGYRVDDFEIKYKP